MSALETYSIYFIFKQNIVRHQDALSTKFSSHLVLFWESWMIKSVQMLPKVPRKLIKTKFSTRQTAPKLRQSFLLNSVSWMALSSKTAKIFKSFH